MVRVSDLMTPVVETLMWGDTLDLAEQLMRAGRIRHLPVIDADERLIGLVTHRKLLSVWVNHDARNIDHAEMSRQIPIDMIMDRDVLTIWPDAPAADAARLLEAHKYGCLPVLNEGKLVGILTEADFVRFARQWLEREDPFPSSP